MRKNSILLLIYTLVFLALFLLLDGLFFTKKDVSAIEDTYLERTKSSPSELNTPFSQEEKTRYESIFQEQKKKLKQKLVAQRTLKEKVKDTSSTPSDNTIVNQLKFELSYIPQELKDRLNGEDAPLKTFIRSSIIDPKVYFLGLEMYEKMNDVRGKFKDTSIKLFWVLTLPKEELFAVFVHEFWHYIDLYYLEETFSWDPSNDFYDISWDSTKVLKKWAKQGNFVSGYAMTNKYEDFAETFVYYTLHNGQFYTLAQKDDTLLKKFQFIKERVYSDESFYGTDFSTISTIDPYYWDITKISYNLDKVLQYLKK